MSDLDSIATSEKASSMIYSSHNESWDSLDCAQ